MKKNKIRNIIAGCALMAFTSSGMLAKTGDAQEVIGSKFTFDENNKKQQF